MHISLSPLLHSTLPGTTIKGGRRGGGEGGQAPKLDGRGKLHPLASLTNEHGGGKATRQPETGSYEMAQEEKKLGCD